MIDIDAYHRDGFVVVRGPDVTRLKSNLGSALAVRALATLAKNPAFAADGRALAGGTLQNIIDSVVRVERNNEMSGLFYRVFPTAPELLAAIADPAVLGWVPQLGLTTPVAGTTPVVLIDRPNDEVHRTPPHQDWWFSLLSPNCVTVWFALGMLDPEIGLDDPIDSVAVADHAEGGMLRRNRVVPLLLEPPGLDGIGPPRTVLNVA